MHFFAVHSSCYNNQRHRDKDKYGESDINVCHKADSRRPEDNRIGQGNHTHTRGHANVLNIIASVRHQITGLRFLKI